MEKADPHKSYHYSHEQVLITAFDYEIRNNLALNPKYDNVRDIVESYLKDRIAEMKEHWK